MIFIRSLIRSFCLKSEANVYHGQNEQIQNGNHNYWIVMCANSWPLPASNRGPADQSLRFYREYFKPSREVAIKKDRLRWSVKYKDTEFYVNLDRMDSPDLGHFLEVKSRTWSRKDAEHKSKLALDLLKMLGVSSEESEAREYVRLVEDEG